MKKVNISRNKIGRFAGKWIVIDPVRDRVIAYADSLKEIDGLITRPISDTRPSGTVPFAFKVPRKDEGPYVLMVL